MTPYYGQSISNVTINQGSYIPNEMLGKANGVATLNESGKIPSSQLDGHVARVQGVDEVVVTELPTESLTEGYMVWITSSKTFQEWNGVEWVAITPVEDTIYNFRNSDATGDTSRTNILYRWDGQNLTEISESLAIGEVEGTAYEGNKGKQNADNISILQSQVGDADYNGANFIQDSETLTDAVLTLDSQLKQVSDATGNIDWTINGKEISSNPILTGEDIVLTNYTRSEATNENLYIQTTDTTNQAIGKLEKAILDNEEVTASALVKLIETLGLTEQVTIPDLSDTNLTASTVIDLIKELKQKQDEVSFNWTVLE